MLVLTRTKGEALVIDENIVVEVVEIAGDKVRLGITCPQDVSVHRREVWELIRRNDPTAAPVDGGE
jgi:carbon storage regulator